MRPICTEVSYEAALEEVAALSSAVSNTPKGDITLTVSHLAFENGRAGWSQT